MASLRLPVHSYALRSTPASPARIVNCYPELLPPDAKTPTILTRVPGILSHAEPGTGPIRGMHKAFGDYYVVSGTELYRIKSNGYELLCGTLPANGDISMAHNEDYLIVVCEPYGYYLPKTVNVVGDIVSTPGLVQITDPDFRAASVVRFLDNYMVFLEAGSARFFCADLASVTDFDSLDFATAEGAPDDLVGMEVDHRQVILFGEESVEIWENTGNAGFPFERAVNGFVEIGCFNGNTVAKVDNSVVWVANDYSVRILNGATPVKISQSAVEQFLSTVDVTGIRAYSYSQDGHFFYVLCASSGCWVWDASTREWHERNSYGTDTYSWQFGCEAHGRQYVGNYLSNVTGYFDQDTYTENGLTQRMSWVYQPVYGENRRALHRRLEVIMETGVGIPSGQGSDPEMMMDMSDDGGKTWRSLPNKKIGAIGQYWKRVHWHALGSARQRVYRGAISDPIKAVLSDTVLEVDGARV